ncbi:MAG: RNA 2'-phosphotransferase [Planctomycetota bacterium]
MTRRDRIGKSKFLSLVLRHDPSTIGIELGPGGWVDVEVLLRALQSKQSDFTRAVLEEIVATNEKRRFAFSEDGTRIRAVQGHSLDVDLGLTAVAPPPELFHGTAERHLASIRASGLHPRDRDYVHLSEDVATARQVGTRHGKPVVLRIDTERMAESGHEFFVADNGVWLTRHVPAEFIETG